MGPEGRARLELLKTLQQLLRGNEAGDAYLLRPLVASDALHICIRKKQQHKHQKKERKEKVYTSFSILQHT